MRGVENNRKGIGSIKCLGKWMLSWDLPLFATSWLQQVSVQVGEAMQRALAEDELFKWLPTVRFVMFCANVFSLITSVAGTWCNATREALSRFYRKREEPKWKLSADVSKSSHVSQACARHQVLLQHGHPSIPSQIGLAFMSFPLPL